MTTSKNIEDMTLDELTGLIGGDLSVALFKGQFHSRVLSWASYICQLNYKIAEYEKQLKAKRRPK